MANIVSATFTDRKDAERAVDWLRDQGVREDAISVASQHTGDRDYGYKGGAATMERDEVRIEHREDREAGGHDMAADVGKGAGIGLGAGAVAGALFGLAAAFIPGIGPLITAGALSTALGAAGGGAAAGAIVGVVSGGLAGALAAWGVEKAEAEHYAGEVEQGSTYVGVDLDRTMLRRDAVEDAFRNFNGRMYSGR